MSFLHQALSPFRAERDACVWASVLPFPPFIKNRERRREYWPTFLHLPLPKRTVHPSKHPWDWVSAHTVISIRDYNQAASQALLVRPRDRQGTPTLSSGLSFKESNCQFSFFSSKPQLHSQRRWISTKSFHNTVDSRLSLLKKISIYYIKRFMIKKKKKEKRERVVGVVFNCNIYHINMYRLHAAG